jgi:predicted nuclease of restriction endonuclease-like (RecB) superfamily
MNTEIQSTNKQYRSFVTEIKQQIKLIQQRTVLAANKELISLYWEIGCSILLRQKEEGWGAKVIRQLSQDLRIALPDLKGFSSRNLNYMRKFAESWDDINFVQQAVAQLPWGHICVLMEKVSDLSERNWYVHKNIEFGWSRAVLIHQIENMLINREGNSTTNFQNILPKNNSELAQQTLKDPSIFDFLSIGSDALERDIENELTKHITSFI